VEDEGQTGLTGDLCPDHESMMPFMKAKTAISNKTNPS